MARGIVIKIVRPIETRKRRKDDVGLRIWTGTRWTRVDRVPYSPRLAYIYGSEPKIVRTKIEFLPPGVTPHAALVYKHVTAANMRSLGVIK